MSALRLFIPITKVDAEKRIVYGVATAEAPDRSGEICDYASSKPFFQAWSAEAEKISGGKSKGNVRAMHNRIAAGKLTAIDFNDEDKTVSVAAKIVDDDEWSKIQEGVYTGFSQGGRYVQRWPDKETGLIRFTADPSEISLVDIPCLPGATFSVVKADGSTEMRKFKQTAEAERRPELSMMARQAVNEAVMLKVQTGFSLGDARKAVLADPALPLWTDILSDAEKPVARAYLGAVDGGSPGVEKAAGHEADESEVEERAKALCAADGRDEVLPEHRDRARAELLAEKNSDTPSRETVTDDVETPESATEQDDDEGREEPDPATKVAAFPAPTGRQEKATFLKSVINGGVAAPLNEPIQIQVFWDGGDFHDTKKDAVRCMKGRKIAAGTVAATAGLDSKIGEIAKALGIETPHVAAPEVQIAETAESAADDRREDRPETVAKADAVASPSAASGVDHAVIHASMTKFHAAQCAKCSKSAAALADMHKTAAASHAEAFLAHHVSADDRVAKSDSAWGCTQKCYGSMGKGADIVVRKGVAKVTVNLRNILAGGSADLGRALWFTGALNHLGKGLGIVAELALLIRSLDRLCAATREESESEKDNSPLPGMLEQIRSDLSDALKAMVAEETAELVSGTEATEADEPPHIEYVMAAALPADRRDALVKLMLETPGLEKAGAAIERLARGELHSATAALDRAVAERTVDVEKSGARNNANDQARIQKVHDLARDLGSGCDARANDGVAQGSDSAKAWEAENESLRAEVSALTKRIASYEPVFDTLLNEVKMLKAQPAPAKASLRAISLTKGEDTAGGQAAPLADEETARKWLESLPADRRALELTKLAMRTPIAL